jgi:uncharacterized protein (DUF2141 family)
VKFYLALAGVFVFLAIVWLQNGQTGDSREATSSTSTAQDQENPPPAPTVTGIGSQADRSGETEGQIGEDRGKPAIETRSSGPLTVRVSGLRSAGTVRVALFDGPAGFPDRKNAARTLSRQINDAKNDLVIDNVRAGTYAVAVFQDLNEDGVLNKNVFGAPIEPYGFSNNAQGRFGPPSFQDASFRVPDENRGVEIRLK